MIPKACAVWVRLKRALASLAHFVRCLGARRRPFAKIAGRGMKGDRYRGLCACGEHAWSVLTMGYATLVSPEDGHLLQDRGARVGLNFGMRLNDGHSDDGHK